MKTTRIALDPKHFPAVREDRKTSTIRAGVKQYRLGPGQFHDPKTRESIEVFITGLEVVFFSALEERHAKAEGYATVDELRNALREYYPDIDALDPVTFVEFVTTGGEVAA